MIPSIKAIRAVFLCTFLFIIQAGAATKVWEYTITEGKHFGSGCLVDGLGGLVFNLQIVDPEVGSDPAGLVWLDKDGKRVYAAELPAGASNGFNLIDLTSTRLVYSYEIRNGPELTSYLTTVKKLQGGRLNVKTQTFPTTSPLGTPHKATDRFGFFAIETFPGRKIERWKY